MIFSFCVQFESVLGAVSQARCPRRGVCDLYVIIDVTCVCYGGLRAPELIERQGGFVCSSAARVLYRVAPVKSQCLVSVSVRDCAEQGQYTCTNISGVVMNTTRMDQPQNRQLEGRGDQ